MKQGVFSSSDTCPCCHCFVLITDNFIAWLEENGRRKKARDGSSKGAGSQKNGEITPQSNQKRGLTSQEEKGLEPEMRVPESPYSL